MWKITGGWKYHNTDTLHLKTQACIAESQQIQPTEGDKPHNFGGITRGINAIQKFQERVVIVLENVL